MRATAWCGLGLILAATTGCSDDDARQLPAVPGGAPAFAFGLDPAQTISRAPYPNDLYRGEAGIALAPLGDDPRFASLATPEALATIDAATAERTAFPFAAPIHLFLNDGVEVDLGSFDGLVHLVALDGPEAGRETAVQTWHSPEAGSIAVFPAWGDYVMPDTTYALLVEPGGKTAAGETIGAPADLAYLIAPEPPTDRPAYQTAWERYAPLRAHLSESGRDTPVLATVFRTEDALAPLQAMIAAIEAAPVVNPSPAVAYDSGAGAMVEPAPIEGQAALDGYFGIAEAPYDRTPGSWYDSTRERAAALGSGTKYTGGSFYGKVAKVIAGSFELPAFNVEDGGGSVAAKGVTIEGGVAVSTVKAMVPFTLYLCDTHLTDASDIPVAVYTHGGTGKRVNGHTFGVANCELGMATVMPDLPFHGGRGSTEMVDGVVVPVQDDTYNNLTGLSSGDAGYVPDHVGDADGATNTVGPLVAIDAGFDPRVIEANLLTISADLVAVTRVVTEGDWSGLHAGLSFDSEKVFHQSLSFGTSYTTGAIALSDAFAGVVGSVGAGNLVGVSLTSAPSNAEVASVVLQALLKIQSPPEALAQAGVRDPIIGLITGLAERGDPIGFAPYVLRHRPSGESLALLHTGNSWDPTLSPRAQVSYENAIGLEVLTTPEYTLDPTQPGVDTVVGSPASGPVSGNVTFGNMTHTAAMFWRGKSCHSQVQTPVCTQRYELMYPPAMPLAEAALVSEASPLCALQTQSVAFLRSILDGNAAGEIVEPAGTCEALFGN